MGKNQIVTFVFFISLINCYADGWYCSTDGQSINAYGDAMNEQVLNCGDQAWETCCQNCGTTLQNDNVLSPGWYCEKDFFSTGIWLKGCQLGSNCP